jgi:hypothetical protein
MSKEKASIPETVNIVKEVVKFRLEQEDERRYHSDNWPLVGLSRWAFALSTLKLKTFKEEMKIVSSINWGRNILTKTFPKSENPDEYHSRGGVVYLNEHPVQVLGWKDRQNMIEEGVEAGLDGNWIDYGFEIESEKRGIDLEWSFFRKPPSTSNEDDDNPPSLHSNFSLHE